MGMSHELAEGFATKLNSIEDPIAAVVTIHLYTEYWVDLIIKNKTKTSSKILRWNYLNKLELIFNMDLIPEKLYQNLVKLNKLRNKCAHNLNYRFNDLNYRDYNLDYVRDEIKELNSEDTLLNINIIGLATFAWINDLARKELNLEEEPI
ncbi:hypothetical protein GCM10028778_07980 [Barrientosiimonas marina]|uniref:Uncharacterized protein n=1 Tax=Lentibacillus kimchii TaxID=1542911 RepID=A0ABW2UXM8_9BACI